ncbi:MAG: DUF499 domain-containing protein [Bryobacteraceae bacterium]
MKTVKTLCDPVASVFESSRANTVANIADLNSGQIDVGRFFQENHVTDGMRTLLTQVYDRLLGSSPQGVFRLKQAMGGGKTHNLIAAGLLARHPDWRQKVLRELGRTVSSDPVRLAAFDGRETDTKDYIWVEIFRKLDVLNKWTGGATDVPGPTTWANVIGPGPALIVLDEMPPYLEYLSMRKAGVDQTEADRVTLGLANLMNAIMTNQLPHCCLVITDLISSWEKGSAAINEAVEKTLKQLNQEATRVSLDITPVRPDGTEVYAILRKRLFSKLPGDAEVAEVSKGYAKAYRTAIQQKVMPESLDRWAHEVSRTYPFHPGMEDLFARFRENPGFQQTREIIRIARKMVGSVWQREGYDPVLIHPHELDFQRPGRGQSFGRDQREPSKCAQPRCFEERRRHSRGTIASR